MQRRNFIGLLAAAAVATRLPELPKAKSKPVPRPAEVRYGSWEEAFRAEFVKFGRDSFTENLLALALKHSC